jgi:methylase of polypeptide subunit release factors
MKKVVHWDLYNQNAISDWFDPEWMFGVKKGFDIVIGNPPYMRVQGIEKKVLGVVQF